MTPPHLRSATPADLPRLTALYNHYVGHTAATFDLEPYGVEERRPWFEQFTDDGPWRLLIAERDGRVMGYATSLPFRPKAAYRPSVETSVYVDPEDVGREIGTHLYAGLLDCLQGTGVHRAYGLITLPNAASIRLHEKLGYREVGRLSECGRKFDRWWDVAIFERGC